MKKEIKKLIKKHGYVIRKKLDDKREHIIYDVVLDNDNMDVVLKGRKHVGNPQVWKWTHFYYMEKTEFPLADPDLQALVVIFTGRNWRYALRKAIDLWKKGKHIENEYGKDQVTI